MRGIDKDWQAESDMHTLQQAREIMGNKARMAAAKKKAMRKMDDLKSIVGGQEKATKAKKSHKAGGNEALKGNLMPLKPRDRR